VTFALAIPHCPWIPERFESLKNLSRQLLADRPWPAGIEHRIFDDREPNWSWSAKLWQWSTTTDATHLLQIQDDVIVCRDFWTHLHAMVSAGPREIICLESVLDPPGPSPWYTTGDGMIGVGYVMPIKCVRRYEPSLEEFLEFREKLRPGAIQSLNEDQMIGLYAYYMQYKIWHPRPTIIDHDTSIQSTYGNDTHSHRRPVRTLVHDDLAPASWSTVGPVPHIQMMYSSTPYLCRRWVPGFSYKRFLEAR